MGRGYYSQPFHTTSNWIWICSSGSEVVTWNYSTFTMSIHCIHSSTISLVNSSHYHYYQKNYSNSNASSWNLILYYCFLLLCCFGLVRDWMQMDLQNSTSTIQIPFFSAQFSFFSSFLDGLHSNQLASNQSNFICDSQFQVYFQPEKFYRGLNFFSCNQAYDRALLICSVLGSSTFIVLYFHRN